MSQPNLPRIAKGLAKAGFWTATGIFVFRVGSGIKQVGYDLIRGPIPGFQLAGIALVGVGEVVQCCTIVNGVATFSAGLDVVGGIKEGFKNEDDE